MMNSVQLQGNLTSDVELRFLDSGTALAIFTVANNRKYKDKEQTTFMSCKAWGKTAETIQKYFKKGSQILIEGRLEQENWQDRESGANRSKIVINVQGFHFVGSARAEAVSAASQPASQPVSKPVSKPKPVAADRAHNPVLDNPNLEDIPF